MPATINADNGVVSGSAGVKTTADTSGELALQSNGNTGLTLTTGLNVGIGTSSPAAKLGVSGNAVISDNSSNSALRITQTGAGNALVVEDDTSPDSSPFVVTSNGVVIKGATTSQTILGATVRGIQILGTGNDASNAVIGYADTTTGGGSGLILGRSRGATVGTQTILQNGDLINRITFVASDGTAFVEGAFIESRVDGTPGTNDMPGRLVFSTTADGASSPTARGRIASTGAIGLAGANYGTSGQVLTSAGSGAAPTWTTPAGGSWVFLTSVTASNSATIDIDSNLTTTYKQYAIVVSNYRPVSGGSDLLLRQRISGTYQTSGYDYFLNRSSSSSASFAASRVAGGSEIMVLYNQNATAQSTGFVMYLNNPAYTPGSPNTTAHMVYWTGASNGGNIQVAQGAGGFANATAAVTGYRFFVSTGNISTGTFSLYGIANS